MHQINIKRGLLIIGVSTLLLGTALFTNNNNEKNKLSEDIQRLDAALLSEVSNQDIEMDQQVFDVMDCAGVTESQLRELIAIENVNYNRCNIQNCHISLYQIESEIDNKKLSFVFTSGEEGNFIEDLVIEGCNSASSPQ